MKSQAEHSTLRVLRAFVAGGFIMALAAISIGMSEQSRAVIARWQEAPQKIAEAVDAGVTQILNETAAYVQTRKLTGQPVKVRSGALHADVNYAKEGSFRGYVGTTTRTAAYAKTILGPDATTIKPRNAKHLWIPIADNLNASGLMNMSPREAMELTSPTGKRLLRIFKSKAGNLVAFLPQYQEASDLATRRQGGVRTGARYQRGKKKGMLKGKLLFVLKDQMVIQGTDALAQGVSEMAPRMTAIMNEHLERAGKAI
ncbi:MAG: hypothetical protein IT445_03090 [Phycisphaeraceae bacterium]|nr:hypothetical protein [Phycisphaeraceae bacterium]